MKNLLLGILLFIIYSIACAKNPFVLKKRNVDLIHQVSLEIYADKEICRKDDSITLSYLFRNTSTTIPIALWDHFWFDSYLVIRNMEGMRVYPEHWTSVHHPMTNPAYFNYIDPGQFSGMTKVLRFMESSGTDYYPLTPGLTYAVYCSVSVHRRNELSKFIECLHPSEYSGLKTTMEKFTLFDSENKKYGKNDKKYYTFDLVWDGDISSNVLLITIEK
jgi:hypothetical protein